METYTIWLNFCVDGLYSGHILYALKDDAVHVGIRKMEEGDGDTHIHLGTFEAADWGSAKRTGEEMVQTWRDSFYRK